MNRSLLIGAALLVFGIAGYCLAVDLQKQHRASSVDVCSKPYWKLPNGFIVTKGVVDEVCRHLQQ